MVFKLKNRGRSLWGSLTNFWLTSKRNLIYKSQKWAKSCLKFLKNKNKKKHAYSVFHIYSILSSNNLNWKSTAVSSTDFALGLASYILFLLFKIICFITLYLCILCKKTSFFYLPSQVVTLKRFMSSWIPPNTCVIRVHCSVRMLMHVTAKIRKVPHFLPGLFRRVFSILPSKQVWLCALSVDLGGGVYNEK